MFILPESFDAYHEITKDFQGYLRTQAMFSGARAIAKAETMPSGFFATELIKTSPMTWTQTYRELLAVQRSGSLTMPGEDKLSARPLALAVSESGDAGARLVVFADADMISDEGLNSASLTLAVLAANWLAGQEELVAIPPKEIQSTPVFMKAEQLRMIFIMLVFALPCAVFFGGLSYTMIRRRTR